LNEGFTYSFAVTPPASLRTLANSSLPSFSAMAKAFSPALLIALISIPSIDIRVWMEDLLILL
jgi:hypothetical protein